MPRFLKIALFAAGGAIALVLIVFVAAFALLPRGYVEKEAQRLASNASGAKVTWTSLTPGFSNWSLGVRIRGLTMRAPADGPTRLNARLDDVFVQFKLFPLLFRRVEIAAAQVKGGGIAMTDRGPVPAEETPPGQTAAGVALVLPRVDVEGIDLRTRDALGGGMDLRRLHGKAEIEGSLQSPRAIRIALAADSLFWKPSARDSLVPLPSPLDVSIALGAKDGGKRLQVTDGRAKLGPFSSAVTGEIRTPGAPEEPSLALLIRGTPQSIRSSDPAIRPLAGRSPAAWNATASWDVTIEGPLSAPTQSGRALLKPLSVNAQSNAFDLDQASASWTTRADRTFRARAEGFGGGLTFTADASGSTTPGGVIEGTFFLRAPAERMNGLLPNTPTWTSGSLEANGSFILRAPPAVPDVKWTVVGTELKGTVPGVARPVRKLDFDVRGDAAAITVRSFGAVVGSTTASVTGRVTAGKPLGTGTFQVVMDRFVADEWAPPKGSEGRRSPLHGTGRSASDPAPRVRRLGADRGNANRFADRAQHGHSGSLRGRASHRGTDHGSDRVRNGRGIARDERVRRPESEVRPPPGREARARRGDGVRYPADSARPHRIGERNHGPERAWHARSGRRGFPSRGDVGNRRERSLQTGSGDQGAPRRPRSPGVAGDGVQDAHPLLPDRGRKVAPRQDARRDRQGSVRNGRIARLRSVAQHGPPSSTRSRANQGRDRRG